MDNPEPVQNTPPSPVVPQAVPSQPAQAPPVAPQAPAQQPSRNKKRAGLMIGGGFLLLVIFLLFANLIVPRILVYFSRAANSPGQFSLANSYLFGSPLLAAANGEDKIRVTAFLLDDKGRGVPTTQVSLSVVSKEGASGALPQVVGVQPTTDDFGRAVFEVLSSSPGQFMVVASVGGLEFPQTATLTFR